MKPTPSIEQLQKFFRLEAQREYDNRAVMGGLERMLEPWQAEARAEGLPESLIEAVATRLRDYGRLTPESRAETLKGLWKRITNTVKGLEDIPSAPPEAAGQPPESQPADSPQPETPAQEPPAQVPAVHEPAAQVPVEEPPPPQETVSPPEPPPARSIPRPEGPPAPLDAPVTSVDGVGESTAGKFAKLDVYTLRDLLYHTPRRYVDYATLKPINRLQYDEEVTVLATVQGVSTRKARGGKLVITEAIVNDGTGALRVTWFGQPYLTRQVKEGVQLSLSGKISQYLGRLALSNPETETLDKETLHTNRITPIYPSTSKLGQRSLRRTQHQVVTYWAPRVADSLPDSILDATGLMDLPTALLQVHFPDRWEDLEAARRRLAFDEIFLLQLGVLGQKRDWQEREARRFEIQPYQLDTQKARLPFTLTGAQQQAVADIQEDLASGRPMNRLLQGDVGSGKTAVAALGIWMVVRHDAQAAILAPTSILAEQHYQNMLTTLAGTGAVLAEDQIRLLIGATPETEKQVIREGLESGYIKLIIGTHALLEDPVVFQDLQLAVIDEQHRFGVEQRSQLRVKGETPHLLVMTATPIPRSLALTVYGDLDLSVMDEMPPGRQEIATHVLYPRERERAYTLIRKQLDENHQAFVIYPLVEESQKSEAKAAVEEHTRLQKVFPHNEVGLLHGRLKPDEKETVMSRFRDCEDHILVSTSVVEVGVDVPNATVMLIEGANRFGLAQLHQFRGRVGRGQHKSYCLLIPEHEDEVENERLQAMSSTNDGFVLAERDLEQRGPGEFLGTRQSGFLGLKHAKLTDVRLVEMARRLAMRLFEKDPDLSAAEHQLLAAAVQHAWGQMKGDMS